MLYDNSLARAYYYPALIGIRVRVLANLGPVGKVPR